MSSTRALRQLQPNALTLLNKNLVAWRSPDGWRVAQDRCPHRGAPLSYGRLEVNGSLTCSLHGWQFTSDGGVSYLPTLGGCGGCPAKLRMHPSQVCEHGLLWVWGETADADSDAEARAFAQPLPNAHLPPPECVVTEWTLYRMPITFAALTENLLDDAHGLHAHHGIPGLDRSLARPAEAVVSGESGAGAAWHTWCNVSGTISQTDSASSTVWCNSYNFFAPIASSNRFGDHFRAESFCVPSRADETLFISASFETPAPGGGGELLRHLQRANPFFTAMMHRIGTSVVCQDSILCEADGIDEMRGERWTGERTRGGLTKSDGAVVRLRNYMRMHGAPLTPSRADVRQWEPRQELSVWHMHTRDCPSCRRAHSDAKATAKVLLLVGVAAAATNHVDAAVWLLVVAEMSRGVSRWFETFHVQFRK